MVCVCLIPLGSKADKAESLLLVRLAGLRDHLGAGCLHVRMDDRACAGPSVSALTPAVLAILCNVFATLEGGIVCLQQERAVLTWLAQQSDQLRLQLQGRT